MSDAERSEITNAIWLCRNCHKKVDDDQNQFSANLLFEWRQQHEEMISDRLGKVGDRIRRKILNEELELFEKRSGLARQIIIDKPQFWEYHLTTELIRSRLTPILSRARWFKKELYVRTILRLPDEAVASWVQDKLSEIVSLCTALANILNYEFKTAWGEPGVAGSPRAVIEVCDLFIDACEQLINWEESVRFAGVPIEWQHLKNLLSGLAIQLLDQATKVPTELGNILAQDKLSRIYSIQVTFSLPEGWHEKFVAECNRVNRDVRN